MTYSDGIREEEGKVKEGSAVRAGLRTSGSAAVQGALWGARARDWAEVQEAMCRPLYEAVLRKAGIGKGSAALDIGCGAGLFCLLAFERGARTTGIDAAVALIAVARERVPQGDFRVGEMEDLPYDGSTFDIVTGFNSLQFAANPTNALREARRVVKPGASVVIATWGKPENCDAAQYLQALRLLLPPPPPDAPGPFALSADGALESFVVQSGLTPEDAEEVECSFEYPDLETAIRGLLSAGPAVKAIQISGEVRVRNAVGDALVPFKLPSGAYRLRNTFRFLIARA